ncbi:MAG TPA: hypothetical protein P5509_03265 [Bacteroidales bacterium]|nr:hypothetical protein [Bacteroidales bacterium]
MKEHQTIEEIIKAKVAKYSDQELRRNRSICDMIHTSFGMKDNRLGPNQASFLHKNTLELYYIELRLGNL